MQGIRSLTVWQNGQEVSMTAGYFVTATYLLLLKWYAFKNCTYQFLTNYIMLSLQVHE